MKKNLLAIIIVALQIVNIALTAVLMIQVIKMNSTTLPVVASVASHLNIKTGDETQTADVAISLEDTDVKEIAKQMKISLKVGEGEKAVHMVCDVSLLLNKNHEDYAKYSENFGTYETLIKDAISSVVSKHTEAECKSDMDGLKDEILKAIQEDVFNSDFVYKVAISEAVFG